jgi:hypothetical protein
MGRRKRGKVVIQVSSRVKRNVSESGKGLCMYIKANLVNCFSRDGFLAHKSFLLNATVADNNFSGCCCSCSTQTFIFSSKKGFSFHEKNKPTSNFSCPQSVLCIIAV